MEFVFNGKLTLEDFIQFNETHLKKSFFGKYKYLFYLLLIVIFIYSSFFEIKEIINFASVHPEILLKIFLQPSVIFPILGIVLLIIFSKKIMKPIYKKYYNSNKIMTEIKYFNITEDIINIKSDSEDYKLTKDKIYKILYDDDSIYIYFTINGAHIIKKHFINNNSDYDELVKFMKEKYFK